MNHQRLIFVLALLLFSSSVEAQFAFLRLPNTAPLFYNPAFAGSMNRGRAIVAYNQEYVNIPGLNTFYASYDQVSNRLHGAWGVEASYFTADGLNRTEVAGIYSPKFSLGQRWTVSPAVKLAFSRMHVVGTTPTPTLGLTSYTLEVGNAAVGLGALLNTNNFYVGVNWENMLAMRIYRITNEDIYARPQEFFSIQSGYVLGGDAESAWSLSLNGMVLFRRLYNDQLAHALFRYRWLLAGIGGVRNARTGVDPRFAAIPAIGVKFDRFRVLVNYSQPIFSSPSPVSNNAVEASFSWFFAKPPAPTGSSPGSAGR